MSIPFILEISQMNIVIEIIATFEIFEVIFQVFLEQCHGIRILYIYTGNEEFYRNIERRQQSYEESVPSIGTLQ